MGNYFCGLAVCDAALRNQQMIYMDIMENKPELWVAKNNKYFIKIIIPATQ